MGIPITPIMMMTATPLMGPFRSIMISMAFIVFMVVTMKLAIGEEDTDPCLLKGHNEGRAFLALPLLRLNIPLGGDPADLHRALPTIPKRKRIFARQPPLDETIKIPASGYIH
jgi:hypothetical protein